MACDQEILVLISSYADGQTTPEETKQVETHLGRCPECRRRVEEWGRMQDLLKWAYTLDLPVTTPSPGGQTAATPQLSNPPRRTSGRWKPMRLGWVGGALVAAVVLVGFVYHFASLPPMLENGLSAGKEARLARLPHGILLQVGPGSRIARIDDGWIRLDRGWVKAEVDHRKGRFRVQTKRMDVFDRGTRFTVSTGPDADVVTVEQGTVDVQTEKPVPASYQANAGQAFIATDRAKPEVLGPIPVKQGEDAEGMPLYDSKGPFVPQSGADLDWREGMERLSRRYPQARGSGTRNGGSTQSNGMIFGVTISPAAGLRIGLRKHFADIAQAEAGGPTGPEDWEVPMGFVMVRGVSQPVKLPLDVYYIRLQSRGGNLVWRLDGSKGAQAELPVIFGDRNKLVGSGGLSESSTNEATGSTFVRTTYPRDGSPRTTVELPDWPGKLKPMLSFSQAGVSLAEYDPEGKRMVDEVNRVVGKLPGFRPGSSSVTVLYLHPERKHRLLFKQNWGSDRVVEKSYGRMMRDEWSGSVLMGAVATDVDWEEPRLPAGVYLLWWVIPTPGETPHWELADACTGHKIILPGSPPAGTPQRGVHDTGGGNSWLLHNTPDGRCVELHLGSMGSDRSSFLFRFLITKRPKGRAEQEWGQGWIRVRRSS